MILTHFQKEQRATTKNNQGCGKSNNQTGFLQSAF